MDLGTETLLHALAIFAAFGIPAFDIAVAAGTACPVFAASADDPAITQTNDIGLESGDTPARVGLIAGRFVAFARMFITLDLWALSVAHFQRADGVVRPSRGYTLRAPPRAVLWHAFSVQKGERKRPQIPLPLGEGAA